MGILDVTKSVKQVHPEAVAFVKIGKFYHCYGKDAYILTYLFGYKIKEVDGIKSCGFNEESINKVMAMLEKEKINYVLLDRRNSYEVDKIKEYNKLNQYTEIYMKAKMFVNLKVRISNISNSLQENIFDDRIKKVILDIENLLEGEFDS